MTALDLFLDNEALAYHWATKYTPTIPEDTEDIASEARIALWQAALNYDESRGVKFGTYASTCIRSELNKLYHYHNRQKRRGMPLSLDWHLRYPQNDWDGPRGRYREYGDLLGYEHDYTLRPVLKEALKDRRLLMYALGWTLREIAAVYGVSHTAVHNHVKAARQKLLAQGVGL